MTNLFLTQLLRQKFNFRLRHVELPSVLDYRLQDGARLHHKHICRFIIAVKVSVRSYLVNALVL